MDMYFFWSSSSIKEKKKLCVKNEKKKGVQELIWATAQTVSRYNGTLYRDMALGVCIGLELYCNMSSWAAGKVYCNRGVVLQPAKGCLAWEKVTIQLDCIVTGEP